MKRILLFWICLGLMLLAASPGGSHRRSAYYKGAVGEAGCGPWLGTWSNRVQIDISNTNVDSTLTDFPIKIYLSTSSGTGTDDVSFVFDELTSDANRKKIAATGNHADEYYVEIERWDDASEEAVLHVEIPSVSDSATTTFYLYFDSSESDNTTYIGDTTDAVVHNVWDSDFEAVFHMNQDPNGDVANVMKGSTSNNHTATPSGSMTSADLVVGEAGAYALHFDGSNDKIQPTYGSIRNNAYTISLHLKIDSGISGNAILSGEDNVSDQVIGYIVYIHTGTFLTNWLYHGNGHEATIGGNVADTWYFYSARAGATTIRAWRNNGVGQQHSVGLHALMSPATTKRYIGDANVTTPVPFPGMIAEYRWSTTERSNDWLKATYYTLSDGIVDYGSEVTCP